MFIGLGLRIALLGSAAFWPSELFINGEPGQLMPVDPAYLYQDVGGTTPVTAPAQAVALQLDQSKQNSWADSLGNVWTKTSGDGVVSVSGNTITVTGATTATQVTRTSGTIPFSNGLARMVITATWSVATGVQAWIRGAPAVLSNGVTATLTASLSNSALERLDVATGSAVFVVSSLQYWAGNHDTQPTVGSRQIYGKHPASGYRNMLASSEDFSAAVWTFTGSVRTQNYGIAPDGSQTSTRLQFSAPNQDIRQSVVAGAVGTSSCWVKGVAGQTFAFLNNLVDTVAVKTFTGSWQYITISGPTSNATLWFIGTWLGATARDFEVWHPQSETGSTATTYQRTGASSGVAWPAPPSYDITEAGQPDLHYLHYNGVSSFMVSPTITPGTDKAQVFVGVRKLSDAALGMLIEFGPSVNGTVGSWGHILPDTTSAGSLGLDLRGNGTSGIQRISAGTAPATFVSAVAFDLSGTTYDTERPTKRINGATATVLSEAGSTDTGGGNFTAQILYTGRRAGTSLPFNGLVYCKIVRFGANLTADQIASTERWTAQRTGVAI